jgi:hypothetical protein
MIFFREQRGDYEFHYFRIPRPHLHFGSSATPNLALEGRRSS